MRKVFIGVIGLTFLLIAAAAFAHPRGMAYCNPEQVSAEQQKFFDETKEMRKAVHDKKFELMEAYRTPKPDEKKIDDLEKEIAGIREKIQAKAKELGIAPGFGNCGNPKMRCQNLSKADDIGGSQCCRGPMGGRMGW